MSLKPQKSRNEKPKDIKIPTIQRINSNKVQFPHTFSSEIYLPPDFIHFIQTNYDKISEIEQKIRDFHKNSSNNKKSTIPGLTNNRNLLLQRSKEYNYSTDTATTDNDIKQVISATIVPKINQEHDLDPIRIDATFLNSLKKNTDSFEQKEFAGIQELFHKFPLVFISPPNPLQFPQGSHQRVQSKSNSYSFSRFPLIIEGTTVKLSEREYNNIHQRFIELNSWNPYLRKKKKAKSKRRISNFRNNSNDKQTTTQSGLKRSTKVKDSKADFDPTRSQRINELALDIYNRFFAPYSTKQLTLPPLHASVLALLSQRSASSAKGTPRNGLTSSLFVNQSTNSKNKAQVKLRRQNRKSKKTSSKDTDADDVGESLPLELVQQQQQELNNVSKENVENQPEVVLKQNNLNPNRKSLQQVLDEYLAKNSWHIQDSSKLEKEIEDLKANIKKTDTNLNSRNISFREDVWLSFPKTWSYSSATFQAPKSGLELKTLTPLEYLRKYVVISQPRKHLYDLVFERHRTLENPLGKTISVQIAIKALSEVMGQTFKQEEAQELFYNLLNVKPQENEQLEFDQIIFGGICAACERIYGKYEMENTIESTNNNLFKQRNFNMPKGLNHKNQLETADLEYLASKIMDNQVDKHLAKLLSAICAKVRMEDNNL